MDSKIAVDVPIRKSRYCRFKSGIKLSIPNLPFAIGSIFFKGPVNPSVSAPFIGIPDKRWIWRTHKMLKGLQTAMQNTGTGIEGSLHECDVFDLRVYVPIFKEIQSKLKFFPEAA